MKKVDNINIEALRHKHVLNEKETAAYLGVSRSFLRRDRSEGPRANRRIGPSYLRIGRMIRYLRSDLDFWLKCGDVTHQSAAKSTANAMVREMLANRQQDD